MNKNQCKDELIVKDKIFSPFLLAASFNGHIKFQGCFSENHILYWSFSPSEKAKDLLNKFSTKTEPHIPAKDIFEATQTFWRQIAEMRNGEMNYEQKE